MVIDLPAHARRGRSRIWLPPCEEVLVGEVTSLVPLAPYVQVTEIPRARTIAFSWHGGSLFTMRSRNLTQRQHQPFVALAEPDPAPEESAVSLTREEHARMTRAAQVLQDELAATVRHIDPSEYSEERLQELLAQAQAKSAS